MSFSSKSKFEGDNDGNIKKSPQPELNIMLKTYLENVLRTSKKNEIFELEAKFGTRGIKPIMRIDYDNVIKKLKSSGFTMNNNNYLLRIQNEYTDLKSGLSRMSNVRTEITGLQDARTYCNSNNLDDIQYGITFTQKYNYKPDDLTTMYPVNFDDFNFRVSLNKEVSLDKNSEMVRTLLTNWKNTKKTFRYMNRYTFSHPDYPFIIDLSIVKESDRKGGRYPIPQYTIQDSGVFNGKEHYEIEIECVNSKIGTGTSYNTIETLNKSLKQLVKIILSGLQETNYPVSYGEQNDIQQSYMKLVWGDEYKENMRVVAKNYAGPSSYTLQTENIVDLGESNSLAPNIRKDYTVTDKADGDRKLLYINETGKMFLINTNMSIQFTGAVTKNNDIFNTLIDGEHILHDKNKKFINLYAAFDLYYINGKDIRSHRFSPTHSDTIQNKEQEKEDSSQKNKLFRLTELKDIVGKLKPISIVPNVTTSPIRIERKRFYSDSPKQSIFTGCAFILQNMKDGLFEYETDGLIFTPANLGVGSNKIGETTKPLKISWEHSFKWKPVEANTIDFLLTIKKNESGNEFIGNTFQSGIDTNTSLQLTQYKTVILRVGFDEEKHGYINPCQTIIDGDAIAQKKDKDDSNNYVPMQFFPTNPSDDTASICNIMLKDIGGDEKVIMTEENEIIEDNMIVEFRYIKERDEKWRWVPLRVRYDKTTEFRSGGKNFGNAYHVANSVWQTIHNPITTEMITTGENVPTDITDDDVYYNRVTNSTGDNTVSLRDFHNLFVKKTLIANVSKKGDTLIDFAVGKGGDLPKWISANLKFVFGIDISRDNIQNRMNGACARYLNYKKTTKEMPDALFVHGNSSINIRNGAAIYSDKDKQITKAVFGQGAKDVKELGKGVYNQYGIGMDGFNVSSIQFAVHYMFESPETLQNLLRNVSETTKVGGYFIGTSYDGKEIFKLLKNKSVNESVTIMENNNKLLEITKKYTETEFPDNSSSLGYAIDVFQESINKTFREYLVNYTYFTRMLENYGFIPITNEEARKMNLPSGSGLFSDLFKVMKDEIKRNPKNEYLYKSAAKMSAGERQISFLNRYFIYKKVRNIDTEQVSSNLIGKSVNVELDEEEQKKMDQEKIVTGLPDGSASVDATINQTEQPIQQKTMMLKKAPIKKGKLVLKEKK